MLDEIAVLEKYTVLSKTKILFNQLKLVNKIDWAYNDSESSRKINNVLFLGHQFSGGDILKSYFNNILKIPFDNIDSYKLPDYAGEDSLVIINNLYPENKLALDCLKKAKNLGCKIVVLDRFSDGELTKFAENEGIGYIIQVNIQLNVLSVYNLMTVCVVLDYYKLINDEVSDIKNAIEWLIPEVETWLGEVPTDLNLAKQIANSCVGKTAVFYSDKTTDSIGGKFKNCWWNNARNNAFSESFTGSEIGDALSWTSLPVEKPFAVFNVLREMDDDLMVQYFDRVAQMLSGKRPTASDIRLKGDTFLKQALWGIVLAEFSSLYLAVLNSACPADEAFIDKVEEYLTV